jgi:DNA-binding response OmpR family regulator
MDQPMLSMQQSFFIGDLFIDPIGYQVKVGQNELNLTLKEFNLLFLFAANRGKLVTRSELLPFISSPDNNNRSRGVDVMICRLRKKIELDSHHPKHLISVRGLGYKLK